MTYSKHDNNIIYDSSFTKKDHHYTDVNSYLKNKDDGSYERQWAREKAEAAAFKKKLSETLGQKPKVYVRDDVNGMPLHVGTNVEVGDRVDLSTLEQVTPR